MLAFISIQAFTYRLLSFGIFGILIFSLVFINIRVFMIGFGYNSVIDKKKK